MSAYTTTNITREAARRAILCKVMSLSDSELESIIDMIIFRATTRECRIVGDEEENEDWLVSDLYSSSHDVRDKHY
mgnify:CR=1 FL=1